MKLSLVVTAISLVASTGVSASQLTPTIHNSTAPDAQQKCPGYKASKVTKSHTGLKAQLTLSGDGCNVYGTDIDQLDLSVEYQTSDRLSVTIVPSNLDKKENETYYILPSDVVNQGKVENDGDADKNNLVFEYGSDPSFWFKVKRRDTNEVIFTTEGSKIVYENQFIEFKTQLPNGHNLYGLGETINDFKLQPGTVRTLLNADIGDLVEANLYGTHPFYLEQRYDNDKGSAHGVYLRNAHVQEIKIDDSDLTWRTLGGSIELYFFAGPTPNSVIKQYLGVIGLPAMHQYWTLGYQHSRWGIGSADELLEIAENYTNAGIPLEAMWSDLDHMNNKMDFTINQTTYKNLPQVVDTLHKGNRHYIPLIDGAVPAVDNGTYPTYDRGAKADAFVKNLNGSFFIGEVWPGPCVFPDWLAEGTPDWWTGELKRFHDAVGFDGIWHDMNEISSFCTEEGCPQKYSPPNGTNGVYHDGTVAKQPDVNARNLRFPPYVVNNTADPNEMSGRTIPMESVHSNGVREYDWHNLWGYQNTKVTYNSMTNSVVPGKRPFIITRSTFPGSGTVAGHWGGDNYAQWSYLKYSITQGLTFSLFGMPMFGTDVCGFQGSPPAAEHEQMCNRWVQMASFLSFFRNHKTIDAAHQELYLWESVTEAAKKSMNIRYHLLPYMYTLLESAHENGDPWLRALAWEFPDDGSLADVNTQFMVGPAVMVAPVVEANVTQVEQASFPNARWYDWYNQTEVKPGVKNIDAPLGHIPVYIRGGNVLPLQTPGLTTAESRKGDWQLIIALDDDGKASGQLYLDDGESVKSQKSSWSTFTVENNRLKVSTQGNYETTKLANITVLGLDNGKPKVITVNKDNWLHNLNIEL